MNNPPNEADKPCPFPGLRPFLREEAHYFFGREEHIDELLMKLESNRFVAVVGASGCGKSSLVRAGLLPMLENGFMAEAGPNWRMATMRPGNAPFEQLTQALLSEQALGPEHNDSPRASAMLEATLRRGRYGLVDAMRETLLPEGTNLLVLVDQFEEIFRYREQSSANEADAFVELILSAAQHRLDPRQQRREAPVYVLLTMRSDFIGDCALFLGLPEAINASQFLTPRLNREQCRAAIVGPARAMGGDVDPALANHLLNNLRADADHLPLLQHALMRMWRKAVAARPGAAPTLTIAELEATGGMEEALSAHADEAYGGLNPRQQQIAESMFRSLCGVESDGRATRRLIRLDEAAEIAEASVEQMIPVVEAFRAEECSFLMPPPAVALTERTVLDISHESLIRQWRRLADWVVDEASSARTYRRLRQTANLWRQGQAALWRTPDLEIAEVWSREQQPNAAWANRYGGALEQSMEFLQASIAARGKRQRIRKWQLIGAFATVLAVAAVTTFAAAAANKQRKIAVEQEAIAVEQREMAEEQKQNAEQQKSIAQVQAERANRSSYNAGFTGILDEWLRNPNPPQLRGRLDLFPQEYREFAWWFCRALADDEQFDSQTIHANHGAVNSLAYLANTNRLIIASDDGGVYVVDAARPKTEAEPLWVHPEGKAVLSVAVAPNNLVAAFGCDDGTIGLVDLDSRRLLRLLPATGDRIRTVQLSSDGSLLAVAGDGPAVSIYSVPSGELRQTLTGPKDWIASLAFAPDGASLAAASYDGAVHLWRLDGEGPPVVLRGHAGPVLAVAFAPDGRRLASAGDDRTVKLWDLGTGACRESVEGHAATVNAVAFSPNGVVLASADDEGELRLWSVDGFDLQQATPPQRRHAGPVHAVAFSPNATLATGGSDAAVVLWDANFGLRLDSHREARRLASPRAIAFTTDANRLAAALASGAVEMWEHRASDGFERLADPLIASGDGSKPTAVCFRPSTDELAVGADNGRVALVRAGVAHPAPAEESHAAPVLALAYHDSGQWLASADEQGTIILWAVDDAGLHRKLAWKRHTGGVRSLAFAPQASEKLILASASEDGLVKVWDVNRLLEGSEAGSPPSDDAEITFDEHEDWVNAVAFCPNRPILASAGDDGAIRLRQWDSWTLDAKPARTAVLSGHLGAVTSLSFTCDGETLASGGVDNLVRLWDPQEMQLRLTLPGHLAAVRAVAFLAGEGGGPCEALASLSEDGDLRFWTAPRAAAGENDEPSNDE